MINNERGLNQVNIKNNNDEFYYLINDIVSNKNFQKLKTYNQHYDTSCYEHSYKASYCCYKISKKLGWDYTSLTRAAMLHDFFLYDWHDKTVDRKGLHAFTHPKCASFFINVDSAD